MDLQLKGKTAFITGGSMGIGKAAALELAREGVNVVIAARRLPILEEAAAEIRAGLADIEVAVDRSAPAHRSAARTVGGARAGPVATSRPSRTQAGLA